MRRLNRWVNLIGKQKCRQVYFWILLAGFLLILCLWQRQSEEPVEGVEVSVYLEPVERPAEESTQSGNGKNEMGKGLTETELSRQVQLQQVVREKLLRENQDALFHVTLESDRDVCREKVIKDQAECGFIIPCDIGVRMINNEKGQDITVYQSPASSLTPIIQEKIYAILFEVYAGEIFAGYVADTSELKADESTALEAYRNRLGDGSTFHFTYQTVETEQREGERAKGTEDAGSMLPQAQRKAVLPDAHVLYGFFLYFMLWIGLLDSNKDKERRRYYFSGHPIVRFWAASAEMLFPVAVTLVAGMAIHAGNSLLSDLPGYRGLDLFSAQNNGPWVAIFHALLYVLILWGTGWLVQILLPKRQWLTAAMPVLLLATLVFSPVIIDLADYVPALSMLQNCFPLTWWIRTA